MSEIYYFVFRSESGEYPVLKDPALNRKYIALKMINSKMLILGIAWKDQAVIENLKSYIQLKYEGESLSSICPDLSPVPYIDYTPIKRKSRLNMKIT